MISMFVISSLVSCLFRPVNVPDRLRPWEPIVRKEACQKRINPKLVLAIMDVESAGKMSAKNESAIGLMQIKVGTARMVGFQGTASLLSYPAINIHYGVLYLAKLLRKYRYGWDAVAAYNCGRPHWQKTEGFVCLGQHTPYVSRIVRAFRTFKREKPPSVITKATVVNPSLLVAYLDLK